MITDKQNQILLHHITEGIDNLKGEDITILNLKEIENSPFDYFVICSGNSNTHVSALADAVEKEVREKTQEQPFRVNGTQHAEWILMDYGNVLVHLFQKHIRDYYDLESLWGEQEVALTKSK